jgi:hypothetical protein
VSVHAVVQVPNGRTSFEFAALGGSTRDFEVGDRVPVAYVNGHPETAFIRTFNQQFAIPLLLILFGLPPFALALRAIQMMIRYWNNPEG